MTINTDGTLVLPTLATVAQLEKRYPELVREIDPEVLQETLEEATTNIEGRTGRRLAPFIGHVFQDRLTGIDPNEYGAGGGYPMSWQSTIDMSLSSSLGASDNVRHFHLDHFAPSYPELWTYNVQAMTIYQTQGSEINIDFANGGLLGPDSSDGHCWLRLGTFAPEGSRIQVIYDGGYTVRIPTDLRRACLLQAAKFLILDASPEVRKEMSLEETDIQISSLIGPWVRG